MLIWNYKILVNKSCYCMRCSYLSTNVTFPSLNYFVSCMTLCLQFLLFRASLVMKILIQIFQEKVVWRDDNVSPSELCALTLRRPLPLVLNGKPRAFKKGLTRCMFLLISSIPSKRKSTWAVFLGYERYLSTQQIVLLWMCSMSPQLLSKGSWIKWYHQKASDYVLPIISIFI